MRSMSQKATLNLATEATFLQVCRLQRINWPKAPDSPELHLATISHTHTSHSFLYQALFSVWPTVNPFIQSFVRQHQTLHEKVMW